MSGTLGFDGTFDSLLDHYGRRSLKRSVAGGNRNGKYCGYAEKYREQK